MKNIPKATEFVGTSVGDTIGLVIANLDPSIAEKMHLSKAYRSIGIIGGRVGSGLHIVSGDEAIKATNAEIIALEFARDTKDGAGHGTLMIFGSDDVSDARLAVEITLEDLHRTVGEVYTNEAGHIEVQYTARASHVIHKAFGCPIGQAFGLIVGAPAAIGVVMADTTLKTANVTVLEYSSPAHGTSFSNEIILSIYGESGAVKQAVIAGRDIGCNLLGALGSKPTNSAPSYIF